MPIDDAASEVPHDRLGGCLSQGLYFDPFYEAILRN